jgi:hypothetical protein
MNQDTLLTFFLEPTDDTLREVQVITVRSVNGEISCFGFGFDNRHVRVRSKYDLDAIGRYGSDSLGGLGVSYKDTDSCGRIIFQQCYEERTTDIASRTITRLGSHIFKRRVYAYPKRKTDLGEVMVV